MKPISRLFFLILILALWPRRIVADDDGDSGVSDIINEGCESTPYKNLCKSSIRDYCESPGNDLRNLARIAVKLAYLNATDSQDYMKKMLTTASEPFVQQCLMDCSATYNDAVDNLEDAVAVFDSAGYGDVNSWVAAAMADPQMCEGYFKEVDRQNSPLTSRNTMLIQLCSNALALIKLVASGKE